jgi:hypothetical protein
MSDEVEFHIRAGDFIPMRVLRADAEPGGSFPIRAVGNLHISKRDDGIALVLSTEGPDGHGIYLNLGGLNGSELNFVSDALATEGVHFICQPALAQQEGAKG